MDRPVKDAEFYLKSGKLYSDKVGHFERRADFRRYLERTGVLDKLTRILMELYENPATNLPLTEFVRKSVLDPNPDEEKFTILQQEMEEAKSFRDYLKKENEYLKAEIEKSNPAEQ